MELAVITTVQGRKRPLNEDFIQIKSLEGDLKISHKKRGFGLTVSTKELIYQKPHANYIIKLEDIVGITPYEEPRNRRPIVFHSRKAEGKEVVNLEAGMPHYRIHVKNATLHNRSGQFRLGASQFILPVLGELLLIISKHAGLNAIV